MLQLRPRCGIHEIRRDAECTPGLWCLRVLARRGEMRHPAVARARAAASARAMRSASLTRRPPGRGECGPPPAPGSSAKPADALGVLAPRARQAMRSGSCGFSRSTGGAAPPAARAELWRNFGHRDPAACRASNPSNANRPSGGDRVRHGQTQSRRRDDVRRRGHAPRRSLREGAATRRRSLRAALRLPAQSRDVARRSSACGSFPRQDTSTSHGSMIARRFQRRVKAW